MYIHYYYYVIASTMFHVEHFLDTRIALMFHVEHTSPYASFFP